MLCKVHHFAADTSLLHLSKSLTVINLVNMSVLILKSLAYLSSADKVSLNMKKTELVIFKHQRKKLDSPIKLKLNHKRLYPSKSGKYLGIKIDENLNKKQYIHDIAGPFRRFSTQLWQKACINAIRCVMVCYVYIISFFKIL